MFLVLKLFSNSFFIISLQKIEQKLAYRVDAVFVNLAVEKNHNIISQLIQLYIDMYAISLY